MFGLMVILILEEILRVLQKKLFLVVFLFLGFCQHPCFSQKSDTSRIKNLAYHIRDNSMTKKLINSITRKRHDTLFNVKSEDPYLRYEGKIIRKIIIERIGFEKNVIDTVHTIRSYVTRTANRLHSESKEWIVRQNLFIKEGSPLNSYRVADNERYLRDLDFILDSRIFVKPIPTTADSIDLIVITRDVFSLGGSFSPASFTKNKFQIYDDNLAGLGQRLQFNGVMDAARRPNFGYEWLYRKNNLMGTFVNATLDYSLIATSIYGAENESSYSLQLARALFMPYTRWAGGLTLSHNKSVNVYQYPDSIFEQYRYNIQDYWLGYSFGHKTKLKGSSENRNRKFVALRGYEQLYSEKPTVKMSTSDQLFYHNRTSLLAQVTFFRQDFYKTRYVLGFGRTEDIPYGYRFSFTGGWEKEQEIQRPYAGIEIYRNMVNKNGSFFIYTIDLASYYKNNRSEDGLLSINFTRYSKIYRMGRSMVRHQLDLGYARQYNQVEKRPLNINDTNGITRFTPDSLVGNQRVNLRYQVVIFTPWKLFGFRIAPVARIELAYLSLPKEVLIQKMNLYSGLSGGFRVRNENLIFNTVEFRGIYYPRTVEGISHFGFNIQANLVIKYPTILVNEPATVYN
jgi:hypothetical protein